MNSFRSRRVSTHVCASLLVAASVATLFTGVAAAQTPAAPTQPSAAAAARAAASAAPVTLPAGITPPPGYVLGPDDGLSIVFWKDNDMTRDVIVRPDGKITLPLINDVDVVGLTTDEVRDKVTKLATQYVTDPTVSVIVKAINSRKVTIQGAVGKVGAFPVMGPMTMLELLAAAGGVQEFAKSDKILIIRTENGKQVTRKFNYKQVSQGKKLEQNIELRPGDQVIVP